MQRIRGAPLTRFLYNYVGILLGARSFGLAVVGRSRYEGVSPLRIQIVSEFFYPEVDGGTGQVVTEIARSLASEPGNRISVVTGIRSYRNGEALKRHEEWEGISIRRVWYPNWNKFGVVGRSIGNVFFGLGAGMKLLTLAKPDAVLVTSAPPFAPIAARIGQLFRGIPYAYVIYDLEPNRTVALGVVDGHSLPVRLLRSAQRSWLDHAHTVIAIGRCMRSLVIRDYGLSSDRVAFVPVGANPDEIRHIPYAPSGDRPFRVLYSGNLGRYHDFDALLDAAKILDGKGFEFVIAGTGAKREHVESRIHAERLSNVTLRPLLPKDEYVQVLASSDACFISMEAGIDGTCVPSKTYSIMAAGRAILASAGKDTELSYTIDEHSCGVRVEPGDVAGLTAALLSLKASPAGVRDMARNARSAFESQYTSALCVADIDRILQAAANKCGATPIARTLPASGTAVVTVEEGDPALVGEHAHLA